MRKLVRLARTIFISTTTVVCCLLTVQVLFASRGQRSLSNYNLPVFDTEKVTLGPNVDHVRTPSLNVLVKMTTQEEETIPDYSDQFPVKGNAIFWSSEIEEIVPKGDSMQARMSWLVKMRKLSVFSMQNPTWKKCGRSKNAFIIMNDGTDACARYRHPHDSLVVGEVLSYHLSQLLGMDSVPAVVLSLVSTNTTTWRNQRVGEFGWEEGQYVALIKWIKRAHDLGSSVTIPPVVFNAYQEGYPVTKKHVKDLNNLALSQVVQWGSMIIFDYLTANYDRVASMQDAADLQKSPSIMLSPTRNLRQTPYNGKLWLIDNECGLLDAYSLMHQTGINGERFQNFHRQMLNTMCIFQRDLVTNLTKLQASINPQNELERFARQHEPLLDHVINIPNYQLFQEKFNERLSDVIKWINHCRDVNS